MADLSSLTADQLAEKVTAEVPGAYRTLRYVAALAELQTRANREQATTALLMETEIRAEAAEKERDEALKEAENAIEVLASSDLVAVSMERDGLEARLAETQTAVARQLTPLDVAATHLEMIERDSPDERANVTEIVRQNLHEARKALWDVIENDRKARAALTTHPADE